MHTATLIPAPPAPQDGQSLYEYGIACLRYVEEHGTARLDADQLRWADNAAQAYATTVHHPDPTEPGQLEPHQRRVLEAFSRARHLIQTAQAARARQLAATQRLLDALYAEPAEEEQPAGQDGQPDDPQARALRLLRAALTLIMGPQPPQNGGGGRPAPLVPPGPTRPPQGSAQRPGQPANLPPKDGIAF